MTVDPHAIAMVVAAAALFIGGILLGRKRSDAAVTVSPSEEPIFVTVRPDDLLIFSSARVLKAEQREQIRQHIQAAVQGRPGIFIVEDDLLRLAVVVHRRPAEPLVEGAVQVERDAERVA